MDDRALCLLACPSCGSRLLRSGDGLKCATDGTGYPDHPEALVDLRLPAARAAAEALASDYRSARLAEGWRPLTAEAAQALPEGNPPGFNRLYWSVRRESWAALPGLLRHLGVAPLLLADLGAGFPWLSHRLATLGHHVVAVDLSADPDFGLGAARLYPTAGSVVGQRNRSPRDEPALGAGRFWPVLGDLEHPPLAGQAYDAVICNASLHYAHDLPGALARMAAALRAGGALIVVDTPVAHTPSRGDRPGSRVLGREELAAALAAAGLTGSWAAVRRGWRWTRHRLKARLLGRPDFEFPIVVGARSAEGGAAIPQEDRAAQ